MRTEYDKFPKTQGQTLEIYHVASTVQPWNAEEVAKSPDKKALAEASARDLYRRLKALPDAPNDAEWIRRAGVSSSFFTNLGAGTKSPSDPAVNNLRLVLRAVGKSIPELLIHEADGRVVPAPSRQAVEQAFRDALPDLPQAEDRRAEYLTEVVIRLLALPALRPASQGKSDATEAPADAKPARAQRATKTA